MFLGFEWVDTRRPRFLDIVSDSTPTTLTFSTLGGKDEQLDIVFFSTLWGPTVRLDTPPFYFSRHWEEKWIIYLLFFGDLR